MAKGEILFQEMAECPTCKQLCLLKLINGRRLIIPFDKPISIAACLSNVCSKFLIFRSSCWRFINHTFYCFIGCHYILLMFERVFLFSSEF